MSRFPRPLEPAANAPEPRGQLLHRQCPVCDRDNADQPPAACSRSPWQIKTCCRCGFVYLENAPAYEQFEENFAWEKSLAAETQRRRQDEPLLHVLSRTMKFLRLNLLRRRTLVRKIHRHFAPGRILDVGCGSARHMTGLPECFVPDGIEISKHLAAVAQQKFAPRGGTVRNCAALTGLRACDAGHFTGVVMRSYLEHELQPRAVLQEAWRVLQPGGAIIVKVPNFDCAVRKVRGHRWAGFRFPDHVNYFTPPSLRQLLEETNFAVTRFGFLDHLPISDNMWAVARKPITPAPAP